MRKRLAALLLAAAMTVSSGCTFVGMYFGFCENLNGFILDFILFNDGLKEGYEKGYTLIGLTRKSAEENWYPNLKR